MRATDVQSRKLMAEYQITGPQLICLQTLLEDGPVTTSALAKLVNLANSTVVGILDRLEAKIWIARERSTKDRRVVLVYITDEGRDLLSRAPSPLQDRLAQGLSVLPEKEQIIMAQSVERIVELLEVEDFGAAPLLETQPIETSLDESATNEDKNSGS
ncbi:MarR family transcriptional regulator [bacterium]|nr:MarR family transcriptional regulator [bacterium]